MGRAKEQAMEQSELQWSPGPDKYVCAECVNDDALANVVANHLEQTTCDYCEAESDQLIAAPLESITKHMAYRIATAWTDPAEELMYISKEGGYQGRVLDASDLIFDEIGYYPKSDCLAEDMLASFSEGHWCKLNYALMSPDERLISGWSTFAHAIKHDRRYTFWSMDDPHGDPKLPHPDDMPVGKMLDAIETEVHRADLIRQIDQSTLLWRVRVPKQDENLNSAVDFAAPPLEKAKQHNRMSPAGVVMFYGAEDWQTACLETIDTKRAKGRIVSGCSFSPTRPLRILDLHKLPDIPSFWIGGATEYRETVLFLYQFARELSKPISRDSQEHIEYVPTQAFSEYVRYQMKTNDGNPIDGIRFSSSQNGRACYVVFCSHEQCIDSQNEEQILFYTENSLLTKPVDEEIASWPMSDDDNLPGKD